MYWGQVAAALAIAVATVAVLLQRGQTWLVALAAGVVAYVAVRWAIAWAFRVRYWYRRGTKGHYSRTCPDCGQYIYRLSGDWILECGRCGWRAGWPGVWWVTQSVPARQLRRTVAGPAAVVFVLAGAVVVAGVVGAGVAVPNVEAPDGSTGGGEVGVATTAAGTPVAGGVAGGGTATGTPVGSTPTASSSPTATGTPEPTATPDTGINTTLAERLILQLVNDHREERGLGPLSRDECLDQFAATHSEDMATYGYSIRHGGPDGQSWESRSTNIGQECGGPISENIHSGPIGDNIRIYGEDTRVSTTSNLGLALYAVGGWMNSPGHRENMLGSEWDNAGVGVVRSGGDAYFTIIFS